MHLHQLIAASLAKVGKFTTRMICVLSLFLLILSIGFLSFEIRLPVPTPEKIPSWLAKTLLGENGSLSLNGDLSLLTGLQPGIELQNLQFELTSHFGQAKGEIATLKANLALVKLLEGKLQFSLVTNNISTCLRADSITLAQLSNQKDLYNLASRLRPEYINIQQARLDTSDDCNATSPALTITSFNFNAIDNVISNISATGTLADLPWVMGSSLLPNNSKFPVLHGTLGQLTWSITPEHSQIPDAHSLIFKAQSDNLYEALAITPLPFQSFGAFIIESRWALHSDLIQWHLSELNFANNDWSGHGEIDLTNEKPLFTTSLSINTLNSKEFSHWISRSIDLEKLSLPDINRGFIRLIKQSNGVFEFKAPQVNYGSLLEKEQTELSANWTDGTIDLTGTQSIQGKTIQISSHGSFLDNMFVWSSRLNAPPIDTHPFSLTSKMLTFAGSTGTTSIDGQITIDPETGKAIDISGEFNLPEMSVTVSTNLLPYTYSLESIFINAKPDGQALINVKGSTLAELSTMTMAVENWQMLLHHGLTKAKMTTNLGHANINSEFELNTSADNTSASGYFGINEEISKTIATSPPFASQGHFSWQNNQLQLIIDSMNKGSSHGDGKLFLHPMASPVNITGDINIHTLNFKDFGISLTKLATAENISQLPAQSDEMLSKWVDPIRQTLKAIEGRVAVSIDHITLDKTQGNMEITTLFGQGKAELVRSKMQGDHGGKADISGALDLSDNNLMAVSAQVTGKDIYYHYDHPSVKKISGHMDLDVDLTTAALPKENELLKALRGNVSFKSHPEFGEFMLFDLWGGGIIQTLAQSVGAIEKSKINCAAGLLTFDDGELKINPVLIDSTRVRVNASLAANLISGEIEGYAKPVPKDPALLRNWLPMTVSGTLTNPSVKPQEGAAVVTAARWFYALPAFVLDLATVDHMAKDGRADCEKVFQYRTQSVGHAN